mmetsp:Transcript_39083/g.84113  ORF Transcript_39083/g.84113 Transcript_39083/m.84113 type:complete len:103 (+) Transcript_39083:407-715(+)
MPSIHMSRPSSWLSTEVQLREWTGLSLLGGGPLTLEIRLAQRLVRLVPERFRVFIKGRGPIPVALQLAQPVGPSYSSSDTDLPRSSASGIIWNPWAEIMQYE